MVFIDDLALELFMLALAGIVSLYTTASAYRYYKANGVKGIKESMRPGAVPLGLLGIMMLILGLFGEMKWPLPGSYNILFYDPFMLIGITITGISIALWFRQNMQYVGIFALFSGLLAIYYGFSAYFIKMTASPIAMLGLYIGFGLAGVFTYPATLIYDRLPAKSKASNTYTTLLMLFWIFLLLASLLAIVVGVAAVPQHLLSPP